jgi:hypothetical protein
LPTSPVNVTMMPMSPLEHAAEPALNVMADTDDSTEDTTCTERFRQIASSEAASADDQQRSGMLAMQRSAVVKRQAGKLHICVGVLASSQPLQIASITLGSNGGSPRTCTCTCSHEVLASL